MRFKREIFAGILTLLTAGIAVTHAATQVVKIPANSTQSDIVKAAANLKPSPRQLAWQEMEFYGFIHFGPNTFTGVEWGSGKEGPASFNPTAMDTDQWAEAARAAGMKMLMITVKHHDGFCLWQTRYTKHSVKSIPWKNGKGDVLRELTKSCRKYGLKLGVYLSPADLYQIENSEGLYGNQSKYSKRTIPRAVKGRPFKSKRKFIYNVDDYNEYFLNQLFELLTEYGPVHEVWFDGAHPKRKGGQVYTYDQWYDMIRQLAPKATIAIMGPDVRWCGNEAGYTRNTEWSVIPVHKSGQTLRERHSDRTSNDLGSREKLANALELMWWPAETNTSIRHGWFYRNEKQHVRPVKELVDIWYRSVGGNSTFLLNLTPDKRGLVPEKDAAHLREMGRVLRQTFSNNLIAGAKVSDSASTEKNHPAKNIVDKSTYSCWKPVDGTEAAELTIKLDGIKTFDTFMIQEAIRDYGQRIEKFVLDAFVDGKWQQIAQSTTVGYKRILRFPPVSADKIRIRIQESRISPTIANIGLFKRVAAKSTDQLATGKTRTIPTSKWEFIGDSTGKLVIDGNTETHWLASKESKSEIIINLGKTTAIPGFVYTPRQDGKTAGIIDHFAFYVSKDGKSWGKPVLKSRFHNIKNNPVQQLVELKKAATGRYIKLKALDTVNGSRQAGAAEIGILIK